MNAIELQQTLFHFEQKLVKNEVELLFPSSKQFFTRKETSIRAGKGDIHSNCEIFLQCSGYCKFEFAQQTLLLKTGQVLLVPSGIWHYEEVPSSQTNPFSNLVLIPTAHEISMHFAEAVERCDADGQIYSVPQETFEQKMEHNQYFGYISNMLDLLFADSAHCDVQDEIKLLLRLLLRRISLWNRRLQRVPRFPYQTGANHYSSPARKVREAIEYVSDFPAPELPDIPQIAAALACTPNYLSSIFKRETGTRLHHYLLEKRLAYAEKMLLSSLIPISVIAEQCKFRDSSHFAAVFQQKFGISPLLYRNSKGDFSLQLSQNNVQEKSALFQASVPKK